MLLMLSPELSPYSRGGDVPPTMAGSDSPSARAKLCACRAARPAAARTDPAPSLSRRATPPKKSLVAATIRSASSSAARACGAHGPRQDLLSL
eukprot:scaffold33142_cov101-Isochrysis_galbana.AAC.3